MATEHLFLPETAILPVKNDCKVIDQKYLIYYYFAQ